MYSANKFETITYELNSYLTDKDLLRGGNKRYIKTMFELKYEQFLAAPKNFFTERLIFMSNQSLFFGKLALIGVLIGSGIVSATTVSGTVTDNITGKVLVGALITRLSDTAQTVTDSTGHFSISESPVSISSSNKTSSRKNQLEFSGGILRFSTVFDQKVVIQRFSLNGRLDATIFSQSLSSGFHVINLSSLQKSSDGIYITRIKVNGGVYSFKTVINAGKSIGFFANNSVTNTTNGLTKNNVASVHSAASVDSITVSRFGYKRQRIALDAETVSAALDTANLFVAVEGGTYEQGSDNPYASSDQKPAHQTTISGFIINKYATTFDDYDAFAVALNITRPSDKTWGRGTNPVINVSFYEAVHFANWQSEKDGLTPAYIIDTLTIDTNNTDVDGYRLLTEAEYEYAAKGGKYSNGYLYSGSDSIKLVAWTAYDTNAAGKYGIHPVGTKLPNELGLYDLTGNTGSWLWDRFYKSALAYTADTAVNPRGLPDGQKYNYRAKRYGGPMAKESCNLITVRNYNKQKFTAQCQGFRLARTK